MPLVIVTGQIGAGKSSLSQQLAERGAIVVSADDLVHSIYHEDQALVASLERIVGADLLDDSGEFMRETLAAAIFTDDRLRKAVEAVVHPAVAARLRAVVDANPDDVVVYDVPLWPKGADRRGAVLVVEVTAPVAMRRERLIARGLPAEEADRRIDVQLATPRGDVDLIIENSGERAALATAADGILSRVEGLVA